VTFEPDLLERLRIESDRFARVPVFDKFMLPPEVHARLANLFLEAADEIASHQLFGDPEQLHTLKRELDEARRRYQIVLDFSHHLLTERAAANEIEELRKERDDARREVCELKMPCLGSQKGYAKGRAWNCFNEEDDNA
jgi:hypothetical protein